MVKKKKKEIKFPRNLYKQEGPEILYSAGVKYEYSTVLVKDEKEMAIALKEGYCDDFGVVILGEEEEVVVEAKIDLDKDDF